MSLTGDRTQIRCLAEQWLVGGRELSQRRFFPCVKLLWMRLPRPSFCCLSAAFSHVLSLLNHLQVELVKLSQRRFLPCVKLYFTHHIAPLMLSQRRFLPCVKLHTARLR